MPVTHLHKNVSSIVKINGAEQNPMLSLPVSLLPAIPYDLPLGVKISAYLASIFGVSGGQEDGEGVISGRSRQVIVCFLIQFKRCGGCLLA